MKKILALALTSMLVMGGSVTAVAAGATTETPPVTQTETAAEQTNLYLVPGTYMSGGSKVENGVPSGATKLTQDECAEILTDNAYLCTLPAGETLPVPTSGITDKDGVPYSFNGWWSIVDATVTYFDKVPELSETTYLYADWRADLSQRKEPVVPDESTAVQPQHYMSVKRATTGEEETLTLRVSGTDVTNADKLGYDRPVQLYNGWFELNPGDVITVYSAGLGGSEEIQVAPLDVSGRGIVLENNGSGSNITANYLTASTSGVPALTYRKSLKKRHFRIYIKFQSAGAKMSVYMEPMD